MQSTQVTLQTSTSQISSLRALGEFMFSISRQTTIGLSSKFLHTLGQRHNPIKHIEPNFDDSLTLMEPLGYDHIKGNKSALRKIIESRQTLSYLTFPKNRHFQASTSFLIPGGADRRHPLLSRPQSTDKTPTLATGIKLADATYIRKNFEKILADIVE